MPTRIIREGIISSKAINRLSEKAENFYRRLMSVADDYGRFHAHPSLLRAACYPLRLDVITNEEIMARLADCVAEKLIFLYQNDEYLQIVKFNQQTRSKSKFPEPVENTLLNNCLANDNHLQTTPYIPRSAPNTNTNTDTDTIATPTLKAASLDCRIEFSDYRRCLCIIFKRNEEKAWSYHEEQGFVELVRQPTFQKELVEIQQAYQKRLPWLPVSLGRLLEDWTGTLDKARAEPNTTGKPIRKSQFLRDTERLVAKALKDP